jgi:hypothetical protein
MKCFGCLIGILCCASVATGQQIPVRAELSKESAWTGEKVPLIITLFCPGPFSGTPSFDLPELPQTAIVKIGNPLVGTEEVGEETYMTQRHEFAVYTQRSGTIVIPSFRVRYSGKNDFTSKPESRESRIPELRFKSRRPPDTESMGVVVSVTEMKIVQSWNPAQTIEFVTGDVVQRVITRSAEGTTAMMLPPVSATSPSGIRLHTSAPDVHDRIERGQTGSVRSETLKYQFERAGSYRLPEISFQWWDPNKEKLQHKRLPGLMVQVLESGDNNQRSAHSPIASTTNHLITVSNLLITGLLVGLVILILWSTNRYWQSYRRRPDVRAASELHKACRSSNAQAAYSALLAWFDALEHTLGVNAKDALFANVQHTDFHQQWQKLSQHLFAAESTRVQWNPMLLWAAFTHSKMLLGLRKQEASYSGLPPLNPQQSPGKAIL